MEETWWKRLEDLDKYQADVISLPIDRSHLILGPAGSGKTNLLVLRGSYLHLAGIQNLCVLTFGRVLKEFLVLGSGNYELPASRFLTYAGWARALLHDNEIPFDDAGDFDAIRESLNIGLEKVIETGRPENISEFILIDEAQDYTARELRAIISLSKVIFAVGDDRQRIYRGDEAIPFLKGMVDTVTELPVHYRNGRKICRVADAIKNLVGHDDGMEATSNYKEELNPSTVESRVGLSIRDQVHSALPTIRTQLRAYPNAFIGVLCPRSAEVSAVYDELIRTDIADEVQRHQAGEFYTGFSFDQRIVVATIHAAKGLEFRALHLMGMEMLMNWRKRKRNIAYTGVTRAKTSLSIYGEGDLPPFIAEGVRRANDEPIVTPSVRDLFKAGSR